MTNKLEALGATAATAGSFLPIAEGWIKIAIGICTLAWWVRVWLKDPNLKPPKK